MGHGWALLITVRQYEEAGLGLRYDDAPGSLEEAGPVYPVTGAGQRRRRASSWGRRLVLSSVLLLLVALVSLSCALFVWPAAGRPQHVDAVLSLDGYNEHLREQRALALVEDGYAPVLLFSQGAYRSTPCPRIAHVDVVCFVPRPARTVGEIEFAERYAARHAWHSIMVVPGHAQATRARLLLARCFKGRAVVVPAPAPPVVDLPYEVAYEWGALVKALVVDRGC